MGESEELYVKRRVMVQRHENVVGVMFDDGITEVVMIGSYVEDPSNGTVTFVRDASTSITGRGQELVLTYSHSIRVLYYKWNAELE